MVDKINVLPGISWSAQAAACDAMERVKGLPPNTPFLAIWIQPDGGIRWAKTDESFSNAARYAVVVQEMANAWVRREMEG